MDEKIYETTEEAEGWTFRTYGGPDILPGVLYAAVKATRKKDGMQFGHWAIVVREEDMPVACAAIRRRLDLSIAQHEEDE